MPVLWCKLGLHSWDDDIPIPNRWLIKQTDALDDASTGIQKGTQTCRHCPATRLAYRYAWVSAHTGPTGYTPWRYCSATREKMIDDLPPL